MTDPDWDIKKLKVRMERAMEKRGFKIRDQFGEEGQGKYCEKCGGMCEDIFNHDSQSGLTKEKK